MKQKALFTSAAASLTVLALAVAANAETGGEVSNTFTLMDAARFFGMFFLVMGAIFIALLFTGWLGKRKNKHKE